MAVPQPAPIEPGLRDVDEDLRHQRAALRFGPMRETQLEVRAHDAASRHWYCGMAKGVGGASALVNGSVAIQASNAGRNSARKRST